MRVSDKLKHNYSNYYKEDLMEWRRLGAIDKCKNIIRLCKDVPHEKILEIGAGDGAILQRLHELNFGNELYALEISETGVAIIRKRNIPNLKECTLFDGYILPHKEKQFDIVVLSHVIEHLEHPRQLIYEAARVGKNIFIEVPLEDTCRLRKDFVSDSTGHINFYSEKTIRLLLQSCGLKIIKSICTNSSLASHMHNNGFKGALKYAIRETLFNLSGAAARKVFTYHCSILASKSTSL